MSNQTATRFRPSPQWIPVVALYALAIGWAVWTATAPAAVDWDDYTDHDPPPGYELDIHRVLRRPFARDPKIDASSERMHLMQRSMMQLANATRWGDDRSVKYLLYIGHHDRALEFAEEYRRLYKPLLTIPSKDLIDDPDLPNEIVKLRDWGVHTAVVLWEPLFPRHPYVKIQRVLHE